METKVITKEQQEYIRQIEAATMPEVVVAPQWFPKFSPEEVVRSREYLFRAIGRGSFISTCMPSRRLRYGGSSEGDSFDRWSRPVLGTGRRSVWIPNNHGGGFRPFITGVS